MSCSVIVPIVSSCSIVKECASARSAEIAAREPSTCKLSSKGRHYTRRVRGPFAVAVGVVVGLLLGIGGYTFVYARGASYLTNDPAACANCHVMREQYDGWQRSSHRSVAVCNDCHAPHDLVGKYMTKARTASGTRSTSRPARFPDPIRIPPRNRR